MFERAASPAMVVSGLLFIASLIPEGCADKK